MIEKRAYKWKGRDGSFGGYETTSLDKKNIYAERLIYRKAPETVATRDRGRSTPTRTLQSIFIDDEQGQGRRQIKSQPTTPQRGSSRCTLSSTLSEDEPTSMSLRESFFKIKLPRFRKASYNWKGKRGSIGAFETIDASKKKTIGSIYPLRMLYPKTPTTRGKNPPKKSPLPKSLSDRRINLQESDWESAQYEISAPIAESKMEGGNQPKDIYTGLTQSIIIDDEPIWGRRQCRSQPTTRRGSRSTISRSTTTSEDEPTSMMIREPLMKDKVPKFRKTSYNWKGKRGSMGAFETTDASKKKTWGSIYPERMMYPKTPKARPSRYGRNKRPLQKSFSDWQLKLKESDWKPANYVIPDPVSDIKSKGVNPPKNLYSGSDVHMSSKKDWVKAMMKPPLPKKALPPKEYYSRMKWIEEMEQFSKEQKNTKVSQISLANCCEIVSPKI